MKERYKKNIGVITPEEQARLYNKTALVVGLGGLGGYALMFLSRMGVGHIRFCDYDKFDESNLNRQLFSAEHNLGLLKADTTLQHMRYINSAPEYVSFAEKFTEESADRMVKGCDVVVDALDNVESRLLLEKVCTKYNVPLVFGAVNGCVGNVATILPGSNKLANYYENSTPSETFATAFSAAAVSAYQISETVKVLLGKPSLSDKILLIDVDDNTVETVNF